jgi:hypothetical protein
MENYYHIVLTTDCSNPIDGAPDKYKPVLYDSSGENVWSLFRDRFGWVNYMKIKRIITADASLFEPTYELNRRNMVSGCGFLDGVCGIAVDGRPNIQSPPVKAILKHKISGDFYHLNCQSNYSFAIRKLTDSGLVEEFRGKSNGSMYNCIWSQYDFVQRAPSNVSVSNASYWKNLLSV